MANSNEEEPFHLQETNTPLAIAAGRGQLPNDRASAVDDVPRMCVHIV